MAQKARLGKTEQFVRRSVRYAGARPEMEISALFEAAVVVERQHTGSVVDSEANSQCIETVAEGAESSAAGQNFDLEIRHLEAVVEHRKSRSVVEQNRLVIAVPVR